MFNIFLHTIKKKRDSPDFNCYRAASDPFDLSTQLLFSQAILVIGYHHRLLWVTTASSQKCTITQNFKLEAGTLEIQHILCEDSNQGIF